MATRIEEEQCTFHDRTDHSNDNRIVIDASISRCCWLPCAFLHCGCWPYSTILTLDEDTVTRHDVALCGERTSMRQYSELGTIEVGLCCCFVFADSNLGSLLPSFGCDRDAVEYIVVTLKERRESRRVTAAQVHMQDQILERAESVYDKTERVFQILEAHNQAPMVAPQVFSMENCR